MPEFAFISLNPKKKQQSEHVRKAVRSQAARSSAPVKKRSDRLMQKSRADIIVTDEIRVTRTRTQTVPIFDSNILFHPSSVQLQVPQSVPSLQIAPLAALSIDSASLGDWRDDDSGSQQRSDALSLVTEPTHPNLLLQPLMAAPFSPFLNEYYLKNMACNIPDLDQGTPGLLRDIWYPFALTHEGLMHVIFLTAGSSFANSEQCEPDQLGSVRMKLIELKAQSLFHIRRMMERQRAPQNDSVIAVICKMASYESMYGSLEAYNMHMHALKSLISQRGGIRNLGLKGLLSRMILWIDYNTACIHNIDLHFAEEANALPKPMEFGPEFFVGRLK